MTSKPPPQNTEAPTLEAVKAPAPAYAKAKPPALWLLVLLSAIGPLALNIFQPSAPTIARSFGIPPDQIQWAITVYVFGLAVGQFIYGPLSDRYGRRPLLLLGVGIYIVANLTIALVPDFSVLLIGRVFQALGGCAGMVLTRAIVRDCYDTESSASAYGYITTAMVAVPALSPALGYGLEVALGWRFSFWFLTIFGLVVFYVSLRRVEETNLRPLARLTLASYVSGTVELLKDRAFMGYCGVMSFATGNFFMFLTATPYAVIEVLGGTGKDFSLYYLILAGGYMAGNFVTGRYAIKLGLSLMTKMGHIISIFGSILFLVNITHPSFLMLFLPAGITAFGGGLFSPASMAGALAVRPDIAGTAASLIGALSMFAAIIASTLINVTLEPNLLAFILLYTATTFLAALCSWFATRVRPLQSSAR